MHRARKGLIAVGLLAALSTAAISAGNFLTYPQVGQPSFCASNNPNSPTVGGTTGQQGAANCVQTVPAGPALTGTEIIPADTQQTGSAPPQTVTISAAQVAGASWASPRNFLGNSSLAGTQVNGTGTVTGATTGSPTTAALTADRWILDTNVTSGTGSSAIVTSSPSPPTGFTQVAKVWRASGVLTQPICAWQAVPTPQATQLAGQTVTFSVYLAGLASLVADNGGIVNLVVISGTGTDQGLNGAWTTSPAITPAWTGIATAVTTPVTVTTTFGRYFTTAAIPAAATEVGVGVCFTPTANTAGVTAATDGFAFVGAQLEKAPGPSLYEVRPRQVEILDNEQFVYSIKETATIAPRATCHVTTAGAGDGAGRMQCPIIFPVPMYKAPTMTYAAGFAGFTTTAETTATNCSALAADATVTFIPTTQMALAQCSLTSSTIAVGLSMTLVDNSGSGAITAWTGL